MGLNKGEVQAVSASETSWIPALTHVHLYGVIYGEKQIQNHYKDELEWCTCN